jgi:hypothetical protein
MATGATLVSNTPTQHRLSDSLFPHSRQILTSTNPTIGITTASFAFFCYQSRHHQDLILNFSAAYGWRTGTVKRDAHWLLY